MRCDLNKNITLDALVGRLTAFKLDNFDNYVPTSKNIESTFEVKLSLKEQGKKIKEIYGGDDNVKIAKVENIREKFDHMKMREDENISKYVKRIKTSVSAIRASGGIIEDKKIVRY